MTGQKRDMTELKLVWPVNTTGHRSEIILSPEFGVFLPQLPCVALDCQLQNQDTFWCGFLFCEPLYRAIRDQEGNNLPTVRLACALCCELWIVIASRVQVPVEKFCIRSLQTNVGIVHISSQLASSNWRGTQGLSLYVDHNKISLCCRRKFTCKQLSKN